MGSGAGELVRQARACLAELAALDLSEVDLPELGPLLKELHATRAVLDAADAKVLEAFDSRQAHRSDFAVTAASWLRHHTHVGEADARARVRVARALRSLPLAADALAGGEVSWQHVRRIAPVVGYLADTPDELARLEKTLVDFARDNTPDDLTRLVQAAAEAAGVGESAAEREQRRLAQRSFTTTKSLDGWRHVTGLLAPELGDLLEQVLTGLATPVPGIDGAPDHRTAPQRRHDALADAIGLVADLDTVPEVNGSRPRLTLIADVATIRSEDSAWAARSPLASVLTRSLGPRALELLTCDAIITPLLTDRLGVPLTEGRAKRFVTNAQLTALKARDGGCIVPGCDRVRLEAHHVIPWSQGGLSDVSSYVLFCKRHHHLAHEDGWTVEPDPERPGLFQLRPPDDRPSIKACHTIDRDPGSTTPIW
ncbi:HNH endonuclease signature motif containing protein [Motilibacter rhizosphaerae]|nr:HNH endonuclease signature motif containing protein [Motilibacter rhizosphaerae]